MVGFGMPELTELLILIAIILTIFLVLREFWCWYWKQNKIISLLTDIRNLLENQKNIEIGDGSLNESLSDQIAMIDDTKWQKP